MIKKIPHTYALIFYIIVFAAILTWIVPGGEFDKQVIEINQSKRTVIVPGSFHPVERNPQTWQIFAAFFKGFVDKADIIVFIFMVGGAFMIVGKSRAIDAGIFAFLKMTQKLEKFKLLHFIGVDKLILSLIMLIFSTFGAVFGMSEETIPFVLIMVPLAISMGYDSITGVALVFVAAAMGFAGAVLNPFTIGIAQGIAGLPIFSGLAYRMFAWMVINAFGITYILIYAKKIKKNPEKSLVWSDDIYWREKENASVDYVQSKKTKSSIFVFIIISIFLVYHSLTNVFTGFTIGKDTFELPVIPVLTALFMIGSIITIRKSAHFFVLNLFVFAILFLVIGVMGYGWYMMEIASLFMALGIFSGIAMGDNANKIVGDFLEGAKDIASAALIVGLAGGIIEILNDGKIIDTLLYNASNSFNQMGKIASISFMYIFQTLLNLFIPSGSGQAALTMPIMAPLSDLMQIPRQAAVMAFQFGDGFTNMITPTSGVLMGVLSVARIPYEKWFKWMFPFLMYLIIIAFLLLIPTVTMELSGF